MVINKSWLLSVALLCSATLNAIELEPDQEIEQNSQELTALQSQKKTLHKELETLFDRLAQGLMQGKDKIVFEEQKLCLATFEKAIDQISDDEKAENCIGLLLLLCLRQKEMQAKVELLATNLLEKPSPTHQILHLQVKALKELCNCIRKNWHQLLNGRKTLTTINEDCFSSNQINKQLLLILRLQEISIHKISWCWGLFGIHYAAPTYDQNKINILEYLIETDFYAIDPSLFNQYVSMINQYRIGAYRKSDQALKAYIMELEQIAEDFEKNKQKIEAQLHNSGILSAKETEVLRQTKMVFSLFINKLFCIKNELTALYQQITIDPTKAGLLIRFQNIASLENTENILAENAQVAALFNDVQKIMHYYATTSEFSSQAVCELLFIKNSLQRYLRYQERSPLAKMGRRTAAEYTFASEMVMILDAMCSYILQNTQDPFVTKILTFALSEPQFSSGEAVGAAKQMLIEFTEQISGKKFSSFKDAFLHILCYASPYLAGSVLTWALPLLSEPVKQTITSFFAQQKESNTPLTKDSLTQFVAKNPNILEALANLGSGLINQGTENQLQAPKFST